MFLTLLLTLRLTTANTESRSLPIKVKLMNMDFVGAGLLLGAVCCLLLALQWGGNTLPWRSATIIGLLTGFGIIGILFATLQWILGDKGTISPRILRQRSVLMGCLFEFFHSMTLYIVRFPWLFSHSLPPRLRSASIATTFRSTSRQSRASQRPRVEFDTSPLLYPKLSLS